MALDAMSRLQFTIADCCGEPGIDRSFDAWFWVVLLRALRFPPQRKRTKEKKKLKAKEKNKIKSKRNLKEKKIQNFKPFFI